MTFLSLALALLLEQLRPLRSGNPIYGGFARYVTRLARNFNAGRYGDGVVSWLLAVLPLMLATVIVSLLLHRAGGVFALAWNVGVLYLALGFRHFSYFYTDIVQALEHSELTRARDLVGEWRSRPAAALDESEIARVAIELGLVYSHRHVFGVMAWFIVLGPAGAIGYRLSALLAARWGSDNHEGGARTFGQFARRVYEIIDWTPARLTALGFAAAGDFMGAVECWRGQAANWPEPNRGVVLAAGAGALGIRLGGILHREGGIEDRPQLGEGDDAGIDYMHAAVGLIWRALVLWMFLILLSTFASWF